MGTPSSPWSLSRTNRRVATPCCAYPGLKEEEAGCWPTQGSPVHHPPAAPTPTGMSPSLYEAVARWINGRTGSSVPFLSHGPAANNRFQWRMCFCSVEGLGLIL